MKNRIGIGMIGCGGMGRYVASETISRNKRLELRGICDPDNRAVRATREEINPDVERFKNHRDLVHSDSIDWVMIASWNACHKEHVLAAARAGKAIFCQKPLATTMSDALAMQRAVRANDRPFSMGFNLRYSPHYAKVKAIVDSGALGDIISMEFNETLGFNHGGYIMGDWRRLTRNAGSHILEKCCHDIDLVNWISGTLATRVASFGGLNFFLPHNVRHIKRLGRSKNGQTAYRTMPGLVSKNPFTSQKDIFDNQVVILEYANYMRATFHTNCNSAIPERRMYIQGTEGTLRADVIPGIIEVQRIGFETKIQNVKAGVAGGHGGGDAVLAKELAALMLRGGTPRASVEDGLKSAVTCFAIDKAANTGRVVDVRPYWKRAGIPVA